MKMLDIKKTEKLLTTVCKNQFIFMCNIIYVIINTICK